jgi:hypothetical protein
MLSSTRFQPFRIVAGTLDQYRIQEASMRKSDYQKTIIESQHRVSSFLIQRFASLGHTQECDFDRRGPQKMRTLDDTKKVHLIFRISFLLTASGFLATRNFLLVSSTLLSISKYSVIIPTFRSAVYSSEDVELKTSCITTKPLTVALRCS